MKENWKTIENYPDYQISNLGNVKSLKFGKEKFLKQMLSNEGYAKVTLSNNSKQKVIQIHQLVAIAFLNHKPDGCKIVIDHKDNNKLNNSSENLQIVTSRFNVSKSKKNNYSTYTGVSIYNPVCKWISSIQINKKSVFLGRFKTEIEAHNQYQKALKNISLYNGNGKEFVTNINKLGI